jgi:hypothetical protein
LEGTGEIGRNMANNVKEALVEIRGDMEGGARYIQSQFKHIPTDFERAGKAFSETFKSTYDSVQPLMDVTKDMENLEAIQKRIADTAAGLTWNMTDDLKVATGLSWDMRNHLTGAASATGAIPTAMGRAESSAKTIKQELSLAANLMQSIVGARAKDRIDPGGRQEKRAQRYMEKGQFGAAERAGKRLAQREEDMEIQEYFNADKDGNARKFGKSVNDLAKEQGIDTFGKSRRELRQELLDKARAGKGDGAADPAGKDGKKGGGKDDKPADNPLVTLVTEIKGLMVKLEQKLPTPALRA